METSTVTAKTATKTTRSSVISFWRGMSGGMRLTSTGNASHASRQSGDGAGGGEHGLFGDELPEQSPASRA